uniref:Uncharacterized protein n=1 Tax=Gopherus agassizii TaxID=38772 RepID=A0A452H623_9SAUR
MCLHERNSADSKRATKRARSNHFIALFKNSKKAFSVKDQNRDCFLGEEDLHNIPASFEKTPTNGIPTQNHLVNSAFPTLFGDKLHGSDPEDVIRLLVLMLITMGDWLTDKVGELYREATIDQKKAISLSCILKHRAKDKDE